MYVTITLVGYEFLIFSTLSNFILLLLKKKLQLTPICYEIIFQTKKNLDILSSKARIFDYRFLTLRIILGALGAREKWAFVTTWIMYTS